MCIRLGDYLQQIGLIPKEVDKYERSNVYAPEFCPHHVSHYLGMDIHDTAHIERNVPLKPGMIFTVEPGTIQCFRNLANWTTSLEIKFFNFSLLLRKFQEFIYQKIAKKYLPNIVALAFALKTMYCIKRAESKS